MLHRFLDRREGERERECTAINIPIHMHIYILTQLLTQQNAPRQLLIARPVTTQNTTPTPHSALHIQPARHIHTHTHTTQNSEAPEKLLCIRHPRRRGCCVCCCCSRKRLCGGGPPYWRLATTCRADSGFNEPCVHVCYCITVHSIYIVYACCVKVRGRILLTIYTPLPPYI